MHQEARTDELQGVARCYFMTPWDEEMRKDLTSYQTLQKEMLHASVIPQPVANFLVFVKCQICTGTSKRVSPCGHAICEMCRTIFSAKVAICPFCRVEFEREKIKGETR